uniref:Pholasin n=1 Tax=Pholas dactylus TaxID=52916 RepID=Q8T5Q8_PHODT|nr:pholasin [Pholas dactylus]
MACIVFVALVALCLMRPGSGEEVQCAMNWTQANEYVLNVDWMTIFVYDYGAQEQLYEDRALGLCRIERAGPGTTKAVWINWSNDTQSCVTRKTIFFEVGGEIARLVDYRPQEDGTEKTFTRKFSSKMPGTYMLMDVCATRDADDKCIEGTIVVTVRVSLYDEDNNGVMDEGKVIPSETIEDDIKDCGLLDQDVELDYTWTQNECDLPDTVDEAEDTPSETGEFFW